MTFNRDILRVHHRADVIFMALVIAHVAMKVVVAFVMVDTRPTGDELAYMDAAKALSNAVRDLVRLAPPDLIELKTNVVGNGWFMPGMPMLVAPLYLVTPDASVAGVRLYIGAITFVLWLCAVVGVRTHLGNAFAVAFLVFPSLSPLWVMFTFTIWGDLSAGLLLTVLLVHAFAAVKRFRLGAAPSLRSAVWLGMLAAACLYLRSSTLPLIPLLFGSLLLIAFLYLSGSVRKTAIVNLAVASCVFLSMLLPWSVIASRTLNAPVLTTTTVPLSLAITFGNTRTLCYGPCDKGEIWLAAVRYSREIAQNTGRSAVQVQKAMSKHARADVTVSGYLSSVRRNFGRYLFRPTEFVRRFTSRDNNPTVIRLVSSVTWALYYVFLAAFIVAMVMVVRRSFETQVASILIKMFAASLLLQPFVHVSHGRYWPVFAPFFGLSLGLLMHGLLARNFRVSRAPMDLASAPANALFWMQVAAVTGVVGITVALLLAPGV